MPSLIEKYAEKIKLWSADMDSCHDELSPILKAFVLEIVQASLPEAKDWDCEHEKGPNNFCGCANQSHGFNDCRSAVLENARKLVE